MERWLALFLLSFSLAGCELIADFNRSEIPGAEGSAGTTSPEVMDSGTPDAGSDDDAGTD